MADTDAAGRDTAAILYSVADAAAMLGLSERTVRRRVANGELPAVRVGTAYRIPGPALAALGGRPPDSPRPEPLATTRPVPATDPAPFLAVIERQGAEIADLRARLAVAEERLRALSTGNAPQAHQDAPGTAGPPPGSATIHAVPMTAAASAPAGSFRVTSADRLVRLLAGPILGPVPPPGKGITWAVRIARGAAVFTVAFLVVYIVLALAATGRFLSRENLQMAAAVAAIFSLLNDVLARRASRPQP